VTLATSAHPLPPRTALGELTARASVVPITIEQYQRMIDERIVAEDSSVELLRGMLVRKDRSVLGEDPMGHSPLHVLIVSLLTALSIRISNDRRHLKIQLPIACPPDGAPEPDGSIVRGMPRDYLDRLPGPGDIYCVIEVAHSSLDRDRDDKLPIYAEASIPQYVLINLQNNTIEIYSDPDADTGVYRTKVTTQRHQSLRLNLGDGEWLEVRAEELLP
jgi:Uma2 family endonuclease